VPVSVEMTPEDQDRLQKELAWFKRAEKEHKEYEGPWDHQDVLYHGHKRFLRENYAGGVPRDRDGALMEARKEFGAELHIPYTFSTIETIMPRTLSNRPKMLWLPRDKVAEQNVENVTIVCDAQQQKANYELSLQTTFRSGLKHGLGVRKTYWRSEEFDSFVMKQGMDGRWVAAPVKKKAWDDPYSDDVDIRDFYWDPYADSMQTARKLMQRSWRDTAYVLGKIKAGEWDRYALTAEDVENGGAFDKYREAWAGRRRAMGQSSQDSGDSDIHEVWEIHCQATQEVITILDRTWIVQIIDNPYWHREFPYHGYRPIECEHRFVGVSVIDPIEDLQKELDWLRTDRRWNAMLKLHQAYAYNDGTVDPSQIKIGPGRLIPVNGDPNGLLVPLTVGDIPNSGYQEEAALRADIQLTTGVDDTVSGSDAGAAATTATGVQLVQAAAGLRIQAYTRRGELELIKPEASQWLSLNQQRWTTNRDVRVPAMPTPMEPDRRWAWRSVGPAQMAGEFDVEPEGGATAPDNVPQKRQDALQLLQALTPFQGIVDPQKVVRWVLEKFDVPAAETFLTAPQQVPPETLDILKQLLVDHGGMTPDGAQQIIVAALQTAVQARDQQAQGDARAPQPEDPSSGSGGPEPPEQLPQAA
jgi:hypothetical protein